MVCAKIRIQNLTGLHLRPAESFCREALEYPCAVRFRFHGSEYNAKSMLSVLSACVKNMDEIELVCDGEQEEDALKHLTELIADGLGEQL